MTAAIDFASLDRAVDDRLAAGVDGLLYPVVASEVGRLSMDERRAVTRAVLRTGRRPGAGHRRLERR